MNELEPISTFRPNFKENLPEPSVTVRDIALILWRHLWIIVLIVAVSTLTAAVLSKRTPKAWRANAQILLVQRGPMLEASGQTTFSAPMIESIDTQITLMQSRQLAKEAAQKVGISTDAMIGSSTITPRKDGDNVIDVAVEAGSRQDAIAWANALCQTFVQYKKAVAQHNSLETLHTLQTQETQARNQMQIADARLLAYQQSHSVSGLVVLDPGAQQTAALNAVISQQGVVAGLKNEYATAQAKSSALASQLQQAKSAIQNGSGVRNDNEVIKLQETLHSLQEQRDQLIAQGYGPSFPGKLGPINQTITDTRARLKEAITNLQSQPSLAAEAALQVDSDNAYSDASSAHVKLIYAEQQLLLLQQQTKSLPRMSMDAGNLITYADQAHKLYNTLSSAVQSARLDYDVASGNVQISQPAFAPEDPFRPSHKRDLMVGMGIGVFLSLLAVLLLEQGDRSLRTASDVRRLAEGPVIAVLPQMTRSQRKMIKNGEVPPHLIETYNTARANLSLAMRHQAGLDLEDHQVILVTSAVPGEGKSLTATELAQSYARSGRRVILVNADMRRPSNLPLFQAHSEGLPGLAEVLAGTSTIESALIQSKLPDIAVIHSGDAQLNPMDLISKPRMGEMMKTLREYADVVIIDSPPAAVVADALLLAPYADCVLFVVGVGMADSECVRQTAAALAAASPKMLAYFVNRVPHVIGEPASYAYSDYGSATFPTPVPDNRREYQSSRTLVLDRSYAPAHEGVSEVSGVNGHKQTDGAPSPLRVLPKVGSRLTTLEGPYLGQSFALSPSKELTLGALPDRDIVLARDVTISQIHARIVPEDDSYLVMDDGSTNGTLVNDIPIVRHSLQVGDVLQLGASKFRYE